MYRLLQFWTLNLLQVLIKIPLWSPSVHKNKSKEFLGKKFRDFPRWLDEEARLLLPCLWRGSHSCSFCQLTNVTATLAFKKWQGWGQGAGRDMEEQGFCLRLWWLFCENVNPLQWNRPSFLNKISYILLIYIYKFFSFLPQLTVFQPQVHGPNSR